MMMLLLNGRRNAKELMANKLTENSAVILVLLALVISQVMTFIRMHEQDKAIDELLSGQVSLFQIMRLQTELEELRLKSINELPPYRRDIES
jgi:hypothetical protein